MGVVFQARHIFLKTAHAIKVILPDLVGNDPMLVTRFRQEALAAAAIRHQNIIAVTDFGVVRGTMPFLVMEYVSGQSLHDMLAEEGALPPARALEIISAVGAGVAAAHRQGIVHRDLKPLNIMFQEGLPLAEAVKVLDFGLAKIKSGELLGSFIQAKTSGLMGSPFYMAPEQWGDEEPDARADIYSLGVILYQMLGGDVPFKGTSIPSIMKKHLTLSPPSFASLGVQVPPQIEAVVRHALEKEPENRPASVEDFINELREAVTALSASLSRTSLSTNISQAQTIIAPHGVTSIPPDATTLRIHTNPPGSRVYINNVSVGVTDAGGMLVVADMLRGQHRVQILHDGYEEWNSQVECQGGVCEVNAHLRNLMVTSGPLPSVFGHHSPEAVSGPLPGEPPVTHTSQAAMEAQRLRQQAAALEEQARAEEEAFKREREERERLASEEEEARRAAESARRAAEEEERRRAEEEEAARLKAEAEAREAERIRAEEEEHRAAEAARLKAEEERARAAEEERQRLIEAEAQRKAEEEAAHQRAEDEARRQQEEERLRLAEEARKRREREEAEARRKREEEEAEEERERQEREEQSRLNASATTLNTHLSELNLDSTQGQRQGVTTGEIDVNSLHGAERPAAGWQPGHQASSQGRASSGQGQQTFDNSLHNVAVPLPQKSGVGKTLIAAIIGIILIGGGVSAWYFLRARPDAEQQKKEETAASPTPGTSPTPQVSPTPTPKPTPFTVEMIPIPGGTFQMGRTDGTNTEVPVRKATVKPFEIDKTEVTNAEYAAFVHEMNYKPPSNWSGDQPFTGSEMLPVTNVSYEDALEFAKWRSKRDGVTYRLPTEEEWEYAARGGNLGNLYPWGNTWVTGNAVTKDSGAAGPKPVGSFPGDKSRWGVMDMAGNVYEWTSSKASYYPGNPTAVEPGHRNWMIVRGGAYVTDHTQKSPTTFRDWFAPSTKEPVIGFRLVRGGSVSARSDAPAKGSMPSLSRLLNENKLSPARAAGRQIAASKRSY